MAERVRQQIKRHPYTYTLTDGTVKTGVNWKVDYRTKKGERIRKFFPTKREADDFLTKAKGEIKAGTHTPSSKSVTIAEAAALWIEGGTIDGLEKSTLKQYEQHAKYHIVPLIGAVKLSDLTKAEVGQFRLDLLKDGRSQVLTRKVMVSLRSLINHAMDAELVAQNVALGSRVKQKRQQLIAARSKPTITEGRDFPTAEEVSAILAAADGRWKVIFMTAAYTGMRASELRGLTWAAVNLTKGIISIRQRANLWGDMGEPKSAASNRDIDMPSPLLQAMKEWKLASPATGPEDLVFPDTPERRTRKATGEQRDFIFDHTKLARGFKAVQQAAGVKAGYGLHTLRHFYASSLIQHAQLSPKQIQALLGHSSIRVTYDIYGHLMQDETRAKKIDAAFGQISG